VISHSILKIFICNNQF